MILFYHNENHSNAKWSEEPGAWKRRKKPLHQPTSYPGKTIARGIAEAHCYSNAMNIL